jgi:predicted DNA-binding protein with PD1-like motif
VTARSIRQPGPPGAERILTVPCGTLPIDVILPAGVRLLDALAALLNGSTESACLTLTGGALGPFAYVIPSLPLDPTHAAFYSDTFRPSGATRLETAAVTLGLHDGHPFFHCHALWTEADGRQGCGHVLPDETIIHSPIHATGAAIVGARFVVRPDPETGFSLFTPEPTGTSPAPGARPGVAIRLAPNQDLTAALESAARSAGFAHAAVQGGVASIIGARFADAPPVNGYATEMLVRRGTVMPTELDIAIVDLHGTIGTGRLVAGDNPVLMTFEGLLTMEQTP